MPSGITVIKQPDTFQPAFNPQWFVASSTNVAQPNFVYEIVCTDLITSETQTYRCAQEPVTGKLQFDAGIFAEQRVVNDIPKLEYGWQLVSGGVRKIRVNIGERYDIAGVSTYTAGSNIDYIVWNGVLNLLEEVNYSKNDYLYDKTVPNIKYLSNNYYPTLANHALGVEYTYPGRSNFLYVLTKGAGDFGRLIVDTYDSAGSNIGTSYISNPYQASTTYTDKYLMIDVGHKGLTNIGAGLVTGAYPIITANTAYYILTDETTYGSPPTLYLQKIKRVDIICEGKHDVIALHYLGKKGQFETLLCSKVSERRHNKTSTSFSEQPYYRDGSDNVKVDYSSMVEKVTDMTVNSRLILNSDYLSANDMIRHQELFTSPEVYCDMGNSLGFFAVKVNTADYLEPKRYNPKTNILIEVQYTHENSRQRA